MEKSNIQDEEAQIIRNKCNLINGKIRWENNERQLQKGCNIRANLDGFTAGRLSISLIYKQEHPLERK